MASPHTSELRFLTAAGVPLDRPGEWAPCLMVIPCDIDEREEVAVRINGRPTPISIRQVGDEWVVVVDWDRSGPGWYDIEVTVATRTETTRLRIEPAKISKDALGTLLTDLEVRLPVAIAVALQDHGARIGVTFEPTKKQTLETEVARLRRAVYGAGRPGLVAVLMALADDPHRMLVNVDEWVKRRHARRPHPSGLVRSLWRAGNIEDGQPLRVLDRRVEHTVDLYENRLLKAFAVEVERHLRRLGGVVSVRHEELAREVNDMLDLVVRARRAARFLQDVGSLRAAPDRVTMVLLKRREYRAGFEGFLEFRRSMSVHLDEPALAEPLRNLPHLYQVWGALGVIEATLEAGGGAGFTVHSQDLVRPHSGGFFFKVLSNNRAALEMRHPDGRRLRLFHERSYSPGGSPLGSISFSQRPDIDIEVKYPDGRREVMIFDPKYKLVSEDAGVGDGSPKKEDVDKMHSYRDSIRDQAGNRVVSFAATLYPGATVRYGEELAAIKAYPGEHFGTYLVTEIEGWLSHV